MLRALWACERCAVNYYTITIQTEKEKPMGIVYCPIIHSRACAVFGNSSNQFLPVSALLALLLKITRLVAPTLPNSAKCFCF